MNNDRFKFRVWDKKYKNYVVPSTVALLPSGVIAETDFAEGLFGTLPFSPDVSTELIIEQCTGILDKTGKLIYEGDVVVRKFVFPGGHSISEKLVVCWEQERFLFDLRRISDNTTPFKCLLMREEEYQIIGNIHEPKWRAESEVKG